MAKPQSRKLDPISSSVPPAPVNQIIAVRGKNPWATGIDVAGNLVADAIKQRSALRQQAMETEVLKNHLEKMGMTIPDIPGGTPENLLKMAQIESNMKNDKLPIQTRTVLLSDYKNNQPLYDSLQDAGISLRIINDLTLGSSGGAGITSSGYVDQDGTPLYFDKSQKGLFRVGDKKPPIGMPTSAKGNQEAMTTASRGAELLPKVDILFDAVKANPLRSKLGLIPGVGKVISPEIAQLKNELKQVGFTFGGKNFTGNEAEIIEGAMIPNVFDNDMALEAKRKAIKGYITGQMSLLDVGNALGPAGSQIRSILRQNKGPRESNKGTKEVTPEIARKLLEEAGGDVNKARALAKSRNMRF